MLNEDDELPEDEEEILVYVEFDGSVASNSLSNEKLQLDMIGLDMEHPIMQVNGKFYEGTYHDAVGTYMFFEGDKNPPVDDPVFDAIPTLKYFAKTRKVLKMNRIFVELKTEMLGDSNDPECLPSMETIGKTAIPPKYREKALRSWEKMRDDRMRALNDYLERQRIRDEKRSRGIEPDSASDDDNPFAVYKPEAKHKKKTKQTELRTNICPEENSEMAKNNEFEDETLRFDERAPEVVSKVSTRVNRVENEPSTLDSEVIDPGPSTSKDSVPWKSPPMEKHENSSIPVSNDDIYRLNLPNVKAMHGATIQVARKAKIRKYHKYEEKKCKKSTYPSFESSDMEIFNPEDTSPTDSSFRILEDEQPEEKLSRIVDYELCKMESSQIVENDRSEEKSSEPLEDGQLAEKSIKKEDNEDPVEESMTTLENMESLSISRSIEESPKKMDIDARENVAEPESPIDKRKIEKQQKRDEKIRHIAKKLKEAADELRLKNQRRLEDAA